MIKKHTYHTIRDHETELVERCQLGDREAAEILLKAHEPFLRKIARHYSRVQGFEFDDALQEARAGFLHGVAKFDSSQSVRLLTYASWWVRHYVKRSLENSVGDIRIPVWKQERDKTRPIRAKRLDAKLKRHSGDDGDETLLDMIPANTVDPDEEAAENIRQAKIKKAYLAAIMSLEPRERIIACERIARHELDQTTLAEIGARLCLSRERVRQIERDVVVKLRLKLVKLGGRKLLAA